MSVTTQGLHFIMSSLHIEFDEYTEPSPEVVDASNDGNARLQEILEQSLASMPRMAADSETQHARMQNIALERAAKVFSLNILTGLSIHLKELEAVGDLSRKFMKESRLETCFKMSLANITLEHCNFFGLHRQR